MRRPAKVAGCALLVLLGGAGYLAWDGAARYRLRRLLSGQARNIPCQQVTPPERTLFPVQPNKFIDRSGRIVLELAADGVENFSEGLAQITISGEGGRRHGFIDASGRMVIAARFTMAYSFSGGLAFIGTGERSEVTTSFGYIDRSGLMVINTDESDASYMYFSECRTPIKFGSIQAGRWRLGESRWGYIDQNGVIVIAPQFDHADGFSEGLALVDLDGKWGFIGHSGRLVIGPQFDYAGPFSEGLARVGFYTPGYGSHDTKWGYIDKSGKLIIEAQFEGAGDFSEGLAWAVVRGKLGYIDHSGRFVIAPQFDIRNDKEYGTEAERYSEGLAGVRLEGKWGYIDRTGQVVIPPRFEIVRRFYGALALVQDASGGQESYIDQTGRTVWPPQKQ